MQEVRDGEGVQEASAGPRDLSEQECKVGNRLTKGRVHTIFMILVCSVAIK